MCVWAYVCLCVRHNSIFIQTCFILGYVDDFLTTLIWQSWIFCCLDIIFQMQIWSRRYYQKCKNDFLYIHWSQCFTSCLDSNMISNKRYSTVYILCILLFYSCHILKNIIYPQKLKYKHISNCLLRAIHECIPKWLCI